jgi:hypothetical protein
MARSGQRTLVQALRHALIVSAVLADLFSAFLAITSLPEGDRNPASPEFGAPQWQWAAACAVAVLLMGGAILANSGYPRRLLVVLLFLTLLVSAEIATHLYKYRIKPRLGADEGAYMFTVAGRGDLPMPCLRRRPGGRHAGRDRNGDQAGPLAAFAQFSAQAVSGSRSASSSRPSALSA